MGKMPSHKHCLCDCSHPQPFQVEDKWYCGHCWHKDKMLCECRDCDCE
jgi:hypothetical protein